MSALVGGTYSTNGLAASLSTSRSSLVSQPAVASAFSLPTLTASYFTRSATQDLTTLTTPSFIPAVGELLIVKAIAEDQSMIMGAPTATGGGITWTKQIENVGSLCYEVLYSGTVTIGGSAITVSMANHPTLNSYHSMVVERWTGAVLAAAPATVNLSNSGAPSQVITTVQANSVVTWMVGDWAAIAPGTPVYRSPAVQNGFDDRSTVNYVGYYATQPAAVAGTRTLGLTSPSAGMNSFLLGIEIQGVAGNQPPMASAGSPQTVASQALVTLTGSGTNSPTSYAWTQTSGTAVTLSSLTVAAPTFTAPADPAGQTLIFSLTATNANGTSAASTVTITVTPQTEWIYYAGSWQPTKSVLL